ncbi:MAG: PEP-CTERM sorting domain-containing protein, partial [Myxococcota bacterium]
LLAVAFNLGDLPPPGIGPVQILADMATFMISSGADFSVNALVVPVPEPGTALLFGLGLAGLATIRKR